MSIILQSRLPFAPWMSPVTARLPGAQPVVGPWLAVDDAYAGQMTRRDQLITEVPQDVLATLPEGQDAAAELYAMLLDLLRDMPGFRIGTVEAERPDGQTVALDASDPLRTLGRLVQEDLCLMERVGDEQVLTAAALCFPASWTLAQKLGHPMMRIHEPVETYTDDVARRVQRLFDAIRPGQMLWRANALVYDDPTLHQPRLEGVRRPKSRHGLYLRSERQSLRRLPLTGAVVFAIHTYVVRMEDLEPEARAGLAGAGLLP